MKTPPVFPVVEFIVPADRQYNGCHVYKPHDFGNFGQSRYIVPAFLDQIPEELAMVLISSKGVHHAKSNKAPEVDYRDLDRLVMELLKLDARNLPRDTIFNGLRLKVKASVIPLPRDTSIWAESRMSEKYPHAESSLAPISVTIIGDLP